MSNPKIVLVVIFYCFSPSNFCVRFPGSVVAEELEGLEICLVRERGAALHPVPEVGPGFVPLPGEKNSLKHPERPKPTVDFIGFVVVVDPGNGVRGDIEQNDSKKFLILGPNRQL